MNTFRNHKGFYSQNNEDVIISNYFRNYVGMFLDVGANDGITLSNTRKLYDEGWSGVLFEPDPKAFKMLRNNYLGCNRVKLIDKAVGFKKGSYDFLSSKEHAPNLYGKNTGLLSSLDMNQSKKWNQESFEKITVDVVRLDEMQLPDFDFVSIDVEGLDFEVLKQLALEPVKMICIEWNNEKTTKKKYSDYLCPYGFQVIHTTHENLIYAK